MSSKLSFLKSCKIFANEMVDKYTKMLKEWQENAITKLNGYCRQEISAIEYLQFVKSYNQVLIKQEYWMSQVSFLTYEIKIEACKNG